MVDRPEIPEDSAGKSALVVVETVEGEAELNGGQLIDTLAAVIRKYVAVSESAAYAIALWIVHTWAFDATETAPRLLIKSPAMRSGKTTLLTLLAYLVRTPISSSNMTPATVFRIIASFEPTLLVDEADTFLKSNGLHGVINSGHKRENAVVFRMHKGVVRPFSTWAPIAIAGIGNLASTIEDRSILVAMKRRRHDETVSKVTRETKGHLLPLQQQIARWALAHVDEIESVGLIQVPGLSDRAEDNWQPLLAIATVAGAASLAKAKTAALELQREKLEGDDDPMPKLLQDISDAFGDADKISSENLIGHLTQLEHRPWAEWRGSRALSKNQLAGLLRPLKIQPKSIRFSSTKTLKGYELAQFEDAFARYLPRAERAA